MKGTTPRVLASAFVFAAACHQGGSSPAVGTDDHSPPQSFYVVSHNHGGESCLLSYHVDGDDGTLRPAGNTLVEGGLGPLVLHPSRRFLYSATPGGIVSLRVDSRTGIPETTGNAPAALPGARPAKVRVHPSGHCVYALFRTDVPSNSTILQAYAVDPTTGSLAPVGNTTVLEAGDISVDVDGRYLRAFGFRRYTFRIEADGAPTLFEVLDDPHGGSVSQASPITGNVYAVQWDHSIGAATDRSNVRSFRVGASGSLEEIGAPLPLSLPQTGSLRVSFAIEPLGRFAYVGAGTALLTLRLDPVTGVPAVVGNTIAPQLTGTLVTDPSGRFLHAGGNPPFGTLVTLPGFAGGDQNQVLGAYDIDQQTGVPEWTSYRRMGAVVGGTVFMDGGSSPLLDPKWAYVVDEGSGEVVACAVEADGRLRTLQRVFVGGGPTAIALDPRGRFVHVGCRTSGDIVTLRVDGATGLLASAGVAVAGGAGVASVAADPSGRLLFVAAASSNEVRVFAIDGSNGQLSPTATVLRTQPIALATAFPGECVQAVRGDGYADSSLIRRDDATIDWGWATSIGFSPRALVLAPSELHAYVSDPGSGSVACLRIVTDYWWVSGLPYIRQNRFEPIGTALRVGLSPSGLAVTPDGRFVYAANTGSDDVTLFHRDSVTGQLVAQPGTFAAGDGPSAAAIHPSGSFAYVTNATSGDVSVYGIDAVTGSLAPVGAPIPIGSAPVAIVLLAP